MGGVMLDLGPMHRQSWEQDPKHVAFMLARYHFVARMLTGYGDVLEIGAGDGTGANIVRPVVVRLVLTDADPKWGHETFNPINKVGTFKNAWDAVYCLDVLEHVEHRDQYSFLSGIVECLHPRGVAVFGTPSAESQPYASKESVLHHVGCHTEDSLRETLNEVFENVFLFGMNDMTLHTGFGPMTHYRLGICTL
jgi:hypothetical protein